MSLENDMVLQAVRALKFVAEKQKSEKGSQDLLEEGGEDVHLHISMKKIPYLQGLHLHRIKIPHPVLVDLKDVCLLTSDFSKKLKADDDHTISHYSQLLKKSGISVGQIIPLHQLRTEYKTAEARRHLARSYQTFVNDRRISKMMPVALGTFFIRKKKMPHPVSLNPSKIMSEFRRALSRTTLTLNGTGSSCGVKVGVVSQSEEELMANVLSIVSYLEKDFPGKWANVQSLHLKTKLSLSIPVYVSLESPNDVELPPGPAPDTPLEGELDTLTRSKVQVYPSGKVKLVKTAAEDIDNENVSLEVKTLASQRYHENKNRKRGLEKKLKKIVFRESRTPKRLRKGKKYAETKKQKVPTIKSFFGFSEGGETVDGLRRKRKSKAFDLQESNSTVSPDKSFEDSFRVQKRNSHITPEAESVERTEDNRIQGQETNNPEVRPAKTKHSRLSSSKRSYTMIKKDASKLDSSSVELLSYSKKDFVDGSETHEEEKVKKRQKKFKTSAEDGTAERARKSEVAAKKSKVKSLSRVQSIRQSVRLANHLM